MSIVKSKKILFLSANSGTGHTMAAKSIANYIAMYAPEISCPIINSYELLNYTLRKIIEEGYIYFIKIFPSVYRYFYKRKHEKKAITGFKDWLNKACALRFKSLLDNQKPDVVVCTHAFPCGVLAYLKDKFNVKIKIIGVITDFVINPFWIYPQTDMYLIPSEDFKAVMVQYGVDPQKIKVTGIPVDPRFNGAGLRKKDARKKLGLDPNLPFLLIMGGGLGMNPAERSLSILMKIGIPLQTAVIMGKNDHGRENLSKKISNIDKLKQNVRLLGYIENVYDYMRAADLLLTKPGGLTTAEAITAGLPMILTSPLPGQEWENLEYLSKLGIAIPVWKEEELPSLVEYLLSHPSHLKNMSEKASKFAVPNSSSLAGKIILSFVESNAKV